jgi:hypothetical protein
VSKGPDQTQDFTKRFARRRSRSAATSMDYMRKLFRRGTPQDVSSPRAKNEGRGKVTADKWNQ